MEACSNADRAGIKNMTEKSMYNSEMELNQRMRLNIKTGADFVVVQYNIPLRMSIPLFSLSGNLDRGKFSKLISFRVLLDGVRRVAIERRNTAVTCVLNNAHFLLRALNRRILYL